MIDYNNPYIKKIIDYLEREWETELRSNISWYDIYKNSIDYDSHNKDKLIFNFFNEGWTLLRAYFLDVLGEIYNLDFNDLIIPSDGSGSIPRMLFAYCESDINKLTISDALYYIMNSSFASSKIKELNILSQYSYIGLDAFRQCLELKKADLSRVKTIRDGAFRDCQSLEEITIKPSTYIAPDAFHGCINLKIINFLGYKHNWLWDAPWKTDLKNSNNNKIIIHCNDGDIEM